jgi:transcriptional accessory protein Tex/SPT6
VLDGARQILMEQFSEDAELLAELRAYLEAHGCVKSTVIAGKESAAGKFQDYFAYSEAILAIPSHRALALFRGRNEGLLQLALVLDSERDDKASTPNPCEARIARRFGIVDQGRPADRWLAETVRWSWRIKVSLHLELELMSALRERAEAEAIRVLAPTCTTCCSPHPPASMPPWASIPACAPASRSPSSMPPASCSTPPRSTRTNRAGTGTARCTPWPCWRAGTRST